MKKDYRNYLKSKESDLLFDIIETELQTIEERHNVRIYPILQNTTDGITPVISFDKIQL
jgi:hypothetical protein